MSDIERLLNLVVPFAVAGASAYCFLRGIFRLLRTNPELAWREVPGRIISSSVDDSGKAKSADIRYTYQVDGDQFEGKKIAPIEIWGSFSTAAEDFVRKYPSGREVTVLVNPRRHRRSVLEPGQQRIAAVCLFLMGIFLAGFAWLWSMITSTNGLD